MAGFNDMNMLDNSEEKELFDLKKIWGLMLLNWYWVLLSVVLCLGATFVYLRYKSPVYAASMKVLVKDSERKGRGLSGMSLALGEMGLMSNSDGFDNELEILGSTSLSTSVAKRLKLYVRYHLEGTVKNLELYKNSPILVDLDKNCLDTLSTNLYLEISHKDNSYHVEGFFNVLEPNELTLSQDLSELPASLQTPYGTITIEPNLEMETKQAKVDAEKVTKIMQRGKRMFVTIYSPKYVGRLYSAKKLSASSTTKTTTVAEVSVTDTKKARALDFLNELFVSYNEEANEDKNEIARKTEEFITDRLADIGRELEHTEGSMESYKKDNDLINLANDATSVLTASSEYRKRLLEAQMQVSVLKSLMDYMDAPENYLQIIPANLGLESSALMAPLVSMIAEYNSGVLKRSRFIRDSSEDNPLVVRLTREIKDMWPSIRQNMENICRNAEIKKNAIEDEYRYVTGRISKTPTQERVLTGIIRQQTLQSELYLALLQKREENFIQLYSTVAKGRMIDEPVIMGKVSPRTSVVLLFGLVMGIVIPVVLLLLIDMLRYRIEGRRDVESLTKLPILADIPVSKVLDKKRDQRAIVVRENFNDVIEEAFRGLRTSIGFVLKPGEKVIMTTSCIPGEGKTFVAANLAMSLALLGKKVVVVGLDIRKPRLVALFGLKPTRLGIVNFLCGAEPDYDMLDKQIIPSGIHANMDVLPAGIIPPNPAELLSGPLLKDALDYLSTKYDYVILDTPPVGLVADTLTIGRLANVTIFVTRADYSPKANFELINSLTREGKLTNCNIVLNGVDMTKRRHTRQYGHYGHYGLYGNYGSATGGVHTEK